MYKYIHVVYGRGEAAYLPSAALRKTCALSKET